MQSSGFEGIASLMSQIQDVILSAAKNLLVTTSLPFVSRSSVGSGLMENYPTIWQFIQKETIIQSFRKKKCCQFPGILVLSIK